MSLFDSFSLPKLSGGGSVLDSAVKYATASTGQLLNEGYAKVQSTLGSVGNFLGLSAKAPSFASLGLTGRLNESDLNDALAAVTNLESPSGTAAQINEENGSHSGSVTSHKVTLTSSAADGATSSVLDDVNFPVEPLSETQVEFDNMPEINEVRTAEYEPLSAPHMPGEFQKYKGTKSTQWQITASFTSRTRNEAKRNYLYLNTLRGWTMPYFGEKQRTQFSGSGKLGAPPPVIRFKGWRGLVGEVPVVIIAVNWTWPKDCDWLPTGVTDPTTGQEIPFPTVMTVNIQMVESFSAKQFNAFDLVAFRNGRMIGAFNPDSSAPVGKVSVSEAIGGQQGITNGTPTPTDDDEHSQTVSEANESVATPARTQDPAPTAGLATAAVPPGALRLSAIAKEISSITEARNQYNSILTNPATTQQTKDAMAAASAAMTAKINALQVERSKLDLII